MTPHAKTTHSAFFDLHLPEVIERAIAIRRDLHAHPELGYQEVRTSGIVKAELDRMGIAYVDGLARGTGVVAHLPATRTGDQHGGTIGLRADMDALPITEQTNLPYASTVDGVMHACGHDGHTANMLAVADVLRRAEDRPNDITFIFQPAEEGGSGAEAMCRDGAIDGSKIGAPVDRIYGLHGWPKFEVGTVATIPGGMMAADEQIVITVEGRQCHGAYPHLGRDPIVAAAHIVTQIQMIVSRQINPLDSGVITIGMINGGNAYNIMPSTVTMVGTIRSLSEKVHNRMIEALERIIRGAEETFDCTVTLERPLFDPPVVNDRAMVTRFFHVARATLGDASVIRMERPTMGGEDFSYYSERIPACFFAVGVRPVGQRRCPTLHQPDYDFNDDAFDAAIRTMCALALDPG